MKKWERFFDILSGTGVGLFLGKLLYLLWHTRAYPELYAMQSAPWYAALLVPGAGASDSRNWKGGFAPPGQENQSKEAVMLFTIF